jgi:hypothetical protein
VVDGSGLENRRTRKGTGGSNPSLSAIQSELQSKVLHLAPKYEKHARISRYFFDKPDCRERTAPAVKAVTVLAFLWRAHAQSGNSHTVMVVKGEKDRAGPARAGSIG